MNMLKIHPLLFFIVIAFTTSCGDHTTKKNLADRERKMDAKERELIDWEQRLKLKEDGLIKLEQRIDSLTGHSDSVGIYNPKLIGKWTVTMQCTETTCEGSAIGDTKTEQWNISYQNNKVVATATFNKKQIRKYTGRFNKNSLQLAAIQTPETDTHMGVILTPHPATEGLMEGERIINQGGKCRIVYTIKAEKL